MPGYSLLESRRLGIGWRRDGPKLAVSAFWVENPSAEVPTICLVADVAATSHDEIATPVEAEILARHYARQRRVSYLGEVATYEVAQAHPDSIAEDGNEWPYRCPSCGQRESLWIASTSFFLHLPDGTEDYQDVEYDDLSGARCPDCSYAGILADFGCATRRQLAEETGEAEDA